MPEVPEFGGDTLFANMYMAYDSPSIRLAIGLVSHTALDGNPSQQFRWSANAVAFWDNRCV
jgi:hypothetical protein